MAEYRYSELNPLNKWEMIKHDIREYATYFAKLQSRLRKKEQTELEAKLRTQQKRLNMINLASNNAVRLIQAINNKIDSLTQKLQKISLYRAQGAILWSKVRWHQQGEKNTKYFFNLEKQGGKAKTMSKTYNNIGQKTTKPHEVLKIQAEFYKRLYTKDCNVACRLNGKAEKQLTEEQKFKLDQPLIMDEITNAVKEMSRNKSPGTSGFQVNIYGMFWSRLKKPLFEAFSHAQVLGILNVSARQGLISLIPKKDRNLDYVKNWRPIILLNTDYKILAKVIANRI